MKFEMAEQYSRVCAHLDGTEQLTADELIALCHDNEACYDDGEDLCLVIQFPGRPQELYTENALRGSLKSDYWRRTTDNPEAKS